MASPNESLWRALAPSGKAASAGTSSASTATGWLTGRVTEVLAGGWLEVELPADDPQTVATGPSDGGVTQVGAIVRVLRDSSGRITQISSPTEVDTSEDAAPVVSMGATGDMIASAMSDAAEAFAQAEVVKADAQAAFDKAEAAATDLAAQKADWQATADKVGTLAGTVGGLDSQITDAQSAAQKAEADAAAAQEAADAAKTAADAAAAAAGDSAAVQDLKDAAQAAQNLATTAKSAADAAAKKADAAATQASSAQSAADKAQAAATAGQSTADAAKAAAATAQAAAVAAQTKADAAAVMAGSVNLAADEWTSGWTIQGAVTKTASEVTYTGGATGYTSAGARTYLGTGTQARAERFMATVGRTVRASAVVSNTDTTETGIRFSTGNVTAAGTYVSIRKLGDATVPIGANHVTVSVVATITIADNAASATPLLYFQGGSCIVHSVSWVDVTESAAAQATADAAAQQAVDAKSAADAAAASALGAQATADAAKATATTASGLYTVAAANPTTSNGSGKPAGAVWEVRSGGTSLRRYVWGGSSWNQIQIGQDFIGPKAIGRAQLAEAVVGSLEAGEAALTEATAGKITVDRLDVTGGATIPVAVINALVGDTAFMNSLLAKKIVVSGDPTNKVGTINMEDGAVTASKIYASEELWAKLAAFGAVTTDMLTAGNATVKGDAVVGTLTGNKLVAGDSSSTATVGPLSTGLFGIDTGTTGEGRATLAVKSSGPYLQFKDGAGAETFYVDGAGNFRMKDRVRGGTVALDNYLASWTYTRDLGNWYIAAHRTSEWSWFLSTQYRVMSPTGQLRMEHRLLYDDGALGAGMDIQLGLYTADPSSSSSISSNLYTNLGRAQFSAMTGANTPSYTGTEVVNVAAGTWYWVRAFWRRSAAQGGTLANSRYWSQVQPV